MHHSRWASRLISKPVNRTQRMMQPRRRLECHIGRPAQTNKLDRALRSGKLVRRLAARANLGPASARGYCGNEVATTGQWKFKISLELGWDNSRQPHDLCDTCDLHFHRLDSRASASAASRHTNVEFANPRDIRHWIAAQQDRKPPFSRPSSVRGSGQSGKCSSKLAEPRRRNDKPPQDPIPIRMQV